MRKFLEEQLHIQFHDWCCYRKLNRYLFAVEHGDKRDARVGARLKRKGVKAGIADYYFMLPNREYNSLWIEIKVGNNKQTKSQKEFEEICKECNHAYFCGNTLEKLTAYLDNYVKN